ncbi:sperm motility kinase 2B-like, partial [Erinaceus europaeus]|uniref:non-specific serine/threonine protein kinase n=1 Tax=Erinaceus europaeus TaxID=9365 RepID=A0ABM3XDH3_ERIEU
MARPKTSPLGEAMAKDDFCVQSTIGAGSFSLIMLAHHRHSGENVVIKQMKMLGQTGLEMARHECNVMQGLSHPNIMPLLGTIETAFQLLLVMPYVRGGDLEDYLFQNGPMREEEARRVFRQLASAMEYCHAKGIAHRDLKPGNILLESLDQVKISDFGLSANFLQQSMDSLRGTLAYMAPEIVTGGTYGPGVDIWSLGVVLYEMVKGHLPQERPARTLFRRKPRLSQELRHLLHCMLNSDPKERIGWPEILSHPWVTQGMGPMEAYRKPPTSDEPAPADQSIPSSLLPSMKKRASRSRRRRVSSSPPVLGTGSWEQDKAREPGQPPKCSSLPVFMSTPSLPPPAVPPNTPHSSCPGSGP